VKPAQFAQQTGNIRRFHQRMVMIRQHAPRERLAGVRGKHGQPFAREGVHALRAATDVRLVLEAGGGDVKTQVTEVGTMRRRMPRMSARLALREQVFALFGRELTPPIFGPGHGREFSRAA